MATNNFRCSSYKKLTHFEQSVKISMIDTSSFTVSPETTKYKIVCLFCSVLINPLQYISVTPNTKSSQTNIVGYLKIVLCSSVNWTYAWSLVVVCSSIESHRHTYLVTEKKDAQDLATMINTDMSAFVWRHIRHFVSSKPYHSNIV